MMFLFGAAVCDDGENFGLEGAEDPSHNREFQKKGVTDDGRCVNGDALGNKMPWISLATNAFPTNQPLTSVRPPPGASLAGENGGCILQ